MICPKCGGYNPDNAQTCERCGNVLVAPPAPAQRVFADQENNSQTAAPIPDKPNTKASLVIGSVVAILIAGSIFAFAIGNCISSMPPAAPVAATEASEEEEKSPTEKKPEPTESVTEAPTETPTEQPTELPTEPPTEKPTNSSDELLSNIYFESTYKIGQDMPAGEYVIFADSDYGGYYSVNSDSTGDLDSIIGNENFDYNAIVTVSDGQYLELVRAYAVPASQANISTAGDGTFRVGYEITPGEFKLESTSTYSGYCAVYDSSLPDAEIVTNDNFDGTTYITVSEGQYLQLVRCKIVQ